MLESSVLCTQHLCLGGWSTRLLHSGTDKVAPGRGSGTCCSDSPPAPPASPGFWRKELNHSLALGREGRMGEGGDVDQVEAGDGAGAETWWLLCSWRSGDPAFKPDHCWLWFWMNGFCACLSGVCFPILSWWAWSKLVVSYHFSTNIQTHLLVEVHYIKLTGVTYKCIFQFKRTSTRVKQWE